jgi:hypothetical protein
MTRRAELDAYGRPRPAGSAGTAGANYRVTPQPRPADQTTKEQQR